MKTRFDLEDAIYTVWQTSKDLDAIFAGLCEGYIDQNSAENALMGLKVVHDLRMEELWNTFIQCHQLDAYSPSDSYEEPDLNVCPGCGGPADNGHSRSIPPAPYFCTKCDAASIVNNEGREFA